MGFIPENTCRRCGTKYPGMRTRCPKCGAPRTNQPTRVPPTTASVTPDTAAYDRAAGNMRWQFIFGGILLVALILAVVVFATDWATAVALAVLCVIAAHELLNAVCGAQKAKRWFGLAGALAVFTIFSIYCDNARFADSALPALAVFFRAAMVVLVFVCAVVEYGGEHPLSFTDICTILVAGVAIPLAMGALLQLRMQPYGGGLVLIPMVAAFCSDSAALFAGMFFGITVNSRNTVTKKVECC